MKRIIGDKKEMTRFKKPTTEYVDIKRIINN